MFLKITLKRPSRYPGSDTCWHTSMNSLDWLCSTFEQCRFNFRIVESWWRYFPNGDTWYRLGVHGFHLGYRKLITRICLNYQNAPFHKNVSRVVSVKSDSPICRYMNINQVIGISHGTQEPMESARYHDIIIVMSSSWRHFLPSPRWRIHKNYRQKKRPDFAINLHIFLVWFFNSH